MKYITAFRRRHWRWRLNVFRSSYAPPSASRTFVFVPIHHSRLLSQLNMPQTAASCKSYYYNYVQVKKITLILTNNVQIADSVLYSSNASKSPNQNFDTRHFNKVRLLIIVKGKTTSTELFEINNVSDTVILQSTRLFH